MFPSLSKLANTLIWSTYMACGDAVWDFYFNFEDLSVAGTCQYFVITGLIYYFWAHGFFQRQMQRHPARVR